MKKRFEDSETKAPDFYPTAGINRGLGDDYETSDYRAYQCAYNQRATPFRLGSPELGSASSMFSFPTTHSTYFGHAFGISGLSGTDQLSSLPFRREGARVGAL